MSDPTRIDPRNYVPFVQAGTAWVAEGVSGLAGFAAIDARSRTVWALFVDPSSEGRGVGRALHDTMLGWARSNELQTLTLTTEKESRAAKFYRRNGWIESAATEDGEIQFRLATRGG